MRAERVVAAGCGRVAVADQVGGDHRVGVGEAKRHRLPVARRVHHPVDQDHGRAAPGDPVDHAVPVQLDLPGVELAARARAPPPAPLRSARHLAAAPYPYEALVPCPAGADRVASGVQHLGLRMRFSLNTAVASSFLCVLVLAAPAPAAFPGENGRIAFSAWSNGSYEIYTVNPDGTALTQLTSDPAWDAHPAWSADGRHIAFNRDIYIWVIDRTGAIRGRCYGPLDYALGHPSVVARRDGAGDIGQLLRRHFQDSGRRTGFPEQVTRHDTNHSSVDPVWSPDGRKIAYSHYSATGAVSSDDIHVVNADGSGEVNLTPTPNEYEQMPNWSPDGRFIAMGDEVSSRGVRVMGADGSNRAVVPGTEADSEPAFSPDGTKLVASTFILAAGQTRLVTYARDGSGRTLIPGTERAEGILTGSRSSAPSEATSRTLRSSARRSASSSEMRRSANATAAVQTPTASASAGSRTHVSIHPGSDGQRGRGVALPSDGRAGPGNTSPPRGRHADAHVARSRLCGMRRAESHTRAAAGIPIVQPTRTDLGAGHGRNAGRVRRGGELHRLHPLCRARRQSGPVRLLGHHRRNGADRRALRARGREVRQRQRVGSSRLLRRGSAPRGRHGCRTTSMPSRPGGGADPQRSRTPPSSARSHVRRPRPPPRARPATSRRA